MAEECTSTSPSLVTELIPPAGPIMEPGASGVGDDDPGAPAKTPGGWDPRRLGSWKGLPAAPADAAGEDDVRRTVGDVDEPARPPLIGLL
jgi:hypothetical protein